MEIRPVINITPLIDVLLVLLIIFMVITPLKPTDFKARIPQQPTEPQSNLNPDTVVVAISLNATLLLNTESIGATIDEPAKITERLSQIFLARHENHDSGDGYSHFEKTVFIKAPRSTDYGSVVKVIDAVKQAGADPISLQIDDLEQ